MKKIGFFVELKLLNGLDLIGIEYGNPGVGGTAYCILTVADQLAKQKDQYEVHFYCLENLNVNPNIRQHVISDEESAVRLAKEHHVDLYIFIAKKYFPNVYKAIDECQLPSIAWVHNFIDYPIIDLLHKTKFIRRIVFVGQQHYDYYIDDKMINKATFIYNIVPPIKNPSRNLTDEKLVMYVGMLGPAKGFHILAKGWKRILEAIPEAKLYVLGSATLYDRSLECGKYGLAEKKYEEQFMQYLIDENGEIMPSVEFCGSLGSEKEEIYERCYVGVANPSGVSETFCLSAVEMETRTIPVVSYNGKGLLDTVQNGCGGFLCNSGDEVAESVIKLLSDIDLNKNMGLRGKEFVDSSFNPDIIMPKWIKVIDDAIMGRDAEIEFSHENMADCNKKLKYLLYLVKKHCAVFRLLPSVAYTNRYIRTTAKKVLRIVRR